MPMLLFYRMLVVLEFFVAEFLFEMRLHRRRYFALRLAACFVVAECFALILPLDYNALYTAFTFFILFGSTIPMLKFCCEESWKNVIFCGIAAYTMQHLAYCVSNLLMTIMQDGKNPILGMYFEGSFSFEKMDLSALLVVLLYLLAYFSTYTVFYYAFIRRINPDEEFRVRRTGVLTLVGFALIVDILLNSIVIYYNSDRSIFDTVMNTIYETLCCSFLLYIQFNLIKTGALRNELDFTQYLLLEKERQYKLSKENIELINLKCHDLRHQIRSIGEKNSLTDDAVKEIERAISFYDAEVRTENEVLDTILTEKSLKCHREGILLTCVVDGHALDFMDAADIYSFFGNALENAIEAVMRLDEAKRNISIVVHRVGSMVSVNVTNPYEGTVRLGGDGLPVTSKGDRNFHGFGLKSMRNIAEKYGGICSVTIEESTFILNALLTDDKRKNA